MKPDHHLLDTIRLEVARSYLKQELGKLFAGNERAVFREEIDAAIDDMGPKSMGIRDFWNTVWGIAMGYKLKITLLDAITAQNIDWDLVESMSLDRLKTGGGLEYIDKSLKGPQSYPELADFFKNHPVLADEWKKKFKKHSPRPSDDLDLPIIVVEKDGHYSIHDGNRRFILACMSSISELRAYAGSYSTEKKVPQNFWISTPLMMEIDSYLKRAENDMFDSYVKVIGDILSHSKTGKEEFLERVAASDSRLHKKVRRVIEQTGSAS